ncbi:hypothetical protein HJC23_011733 [Cyclotella cryptica]|uniref:NADP-dependent oxidoreductase domain-containing protein n=1 Tax=Cyclotella cryptica TaxID=29204 RepID=A0ABD3NJX2_9STRA
MPMLMHRSSSLLAAEEAFATVASSNPTGKYSTFDLNPTSEDNDAIVNVAKNFLSSTCPELLEVLDSHYDSKSARDRLVKIGRNVNATLRYSRQVIERKSRGQVSSTNVWNAAEEGTVLDETHRQTVTNASLDRLVRECSALADLLKHPVSVPKVRYGRTGLQMPIVTLGCMRFQQTWNRGGKPVTSMEQVQTECQENLVNILKHALHCGVNHIETALGYGTSEMQIGEALKVLLEEGVCKREDLIIQTKGFITSTMSKSDFKASIVKQIERLGLEYVDLFSVHGVNTEDHVDWLFDHGDKGNLIDAVRELREEGKVRWIGFSTHAPAHTIKRAIETDAFDYINLHYHFEGSYTASGDGDENFEGNLENIRLANKHDMGVFIISPYDKGGRLYAPSNLLRELTLPEMEPIEFGSLWLWYHKEHKEGDPARIDTIVCGAARPSDFDQPVLAALRSVTAGARQDFEVVHRRIQERKETVFGKDWAESWQVGLPNYSHSPQRGSQVGNMVWLYNAINMFGLFDFAKDRYGTLVGNSRNWDKNKSWKENVFANPGFNWMPGCGFDPSADYSEELKDVPEKNLPRVMEAMRFVHDWCTASDAEKVIPLEWQTAYDMRPWTAFPERPH